ncbi:MAG TPA: hypothetical protein PKN47_01765 [Nitrospira sp.]|nr:hypothetical protein [Nitrospira sp.]
MTFETRMSLLTFNGVQAFPGAEPLYLFTDACTGSTFSIRAGETIGQGLAAFVLRWDALSRDREPAGACGGVASFDHREHTT